MSSIAHFLADGLNYFFLFLVLLAPFVTATPKVPWWRFWIMTSLGTGIGVLLAERGKSLPIWPGHPGFPSGHETVALGAATALVLLDTRWTYIAAPFALLMGWALVHAGYHTWVEISGALITGIVPVACCWGGNRQIGKKKV